MMPTADDVTYPYRKSHNPTTFTAWLLQRNPRSPTAWSTPSTLTIVTNRYQSLYIVTCLATTWSTPSRKMQTGAMSRLAIMHGINDPMILVCTGQ